MTFYVENETEKEFPFDIEEVARSVGEQVLKNENCPYENLAINVLVTDNEGIREYNNQFRGIDKETEPNDTHESEIQNLLSKVGNVTPIEGWHAFKYLHKCTIEFEGKNVTLPLLNLWDFTQGQTFDLLNKTKREKIAQQYAKFVKQEFNNLNSK